MERNQHLERPEHVHWPGHVWRRNDHRHSAGGGGPARSEQRTQTLSGLSIGTGVQAALGVNVGTAGSFVVNGGALGTPSSGVASALTTIGTGATTSPTLANRATDGGVTFNLKEDFGAKCDGSTDDTTAIQAWLNKAAANVRLIGPAGICDFSSALTVGAVSDFTIEGAGKRTRIFTTPGHPRQRRC